MDEADQSRSPPGRSMRFTSSPVKGAYLARQVQKSSASFSRGLTSATAEEATAQSKSIRATFVFTPVIRAEIEKIERGMRR
jgi:hypothetical protein